MSILFLIFFLKNFSTFAQNVSNEQLAPPKKLPKLSRIAPSSPSVAPKMTLRAHLTCPADCRKIAHMIARARRNQPTSRRAPMTPTCAPCLPSLLLSCFVLLRRLPRMRACSLAHSLTHACAHAPMRVCAHAHMLPIIYMLSLFRILSFFVCHVC